MRQYLAFVTALAAVLLSITLTGCGSKGPLTLPQQRPLLVTGSLIPATPASDVNTDAKAGVNTEVNTPVNTTEERAK